MSNNETAFRITIEARNEAIETICFETLKEAKKFLKILCKKLDLDRQRGFWSNIQTDTEVFTTF
mgnify:CR=1|tara:strand:+ start:2948 stop:3139 length:192 start_codon:yes stop_codon:yes gene_type:complete